LERPTLPKRFVIENDGRKLVFEEKGNGLYSISEGLEGDFHVVSMSRSELLIAFEILMGDTL